MDPLALALRAIVIGATAAGVVIAVRALPPVELLVLAGRKPWACDVCASFWATVIVGTASATIWGVDGPVATLPAYALAYGLTRALGAPQTLPPPPTEETR